ncbi:MULTISPECIES: 4-hydroxythreonine-4-phosphate dehydrogenase PdxA [Thermodesulfobacterium]|uniref:4-hydroxythreonine-4-phosphate dehydrogenase PdxA n=1 Tax=Thermodesulfobacterium commune TaxID=1741 RepID=A0A101FK16_9BACT|nr:4-hydroxythreonine-4-phosphate dehydrogenase PdxA [Thermodesulfobacterium sp.]KUJ97087.1 MAG: 4-hydroxythreonine-4-phosphate dehydrogenase [Thermodesulfobacterium sp. 37_54]KUK38449.1 MAG: 4-hydroxythreonine-4-phosphate dehydrogenase [Thermodesulfobacterium commune]MBZ4680987.1 4-hydroxythreonine-4-phosphate dehydrogenase [Thermodesulfobacterium sp.]MDN5378982.1 4-hydroxythreonine-4-phosphate dehydrogenase [Thermodesulfobacterium sp.]HAA84203.1 4-hydroxythreonine-4-phosphate dehydrogenase P
MIENKIGITLGCPAGIGPEVILKSLQHFQEKFPEVLSSLLIIGDARVIEQRAKWLGIKIPPELEILSLTEIEVKPGEPSVDGFKAMGLFVQKAIDLAKEGKIKAIVTGPISKEGLEKVGIKYKGHTEWLAQELGAKDFVMSFYGERLKVSLVTTHIPLKEVPEKITADKVFATAKLSFEFLLKLKVLNPKIALCGVNPHAGEGGLIGEEEKTVLKEAITLCQKAGLPVYGPYPADSLFFWAYQGRYDLVVAMYHDQGLAPFKLIHFEDGVNITLGLPVIRTSPCHGTAYDIANKGVANPSSFIQAIHLAYKLIQV